MYSPFLLPNDTSQIVTPTRFKQHNIAPTRFTQPINNTPTNIQPRNNPYLAYKPQTTTNQYNTPTKAIEPNRGHSIPTNNNNDNYEKYRQLVFSRESSNNYQATNKGNYLGGYQLGASALIEAGLVNPNTTNRGLNNPKNWKGTLSKEAYLSNPYIQDEAFKAYTNKNKQYLGSRFTETPEGYGTLMASHLLGANGSKNLNSTDGNNVRGQDYYNLAYNRFK